MGDTQIRHSEWVISDEFYDRLHELRTTENGSPVSWETSSAHESEASLTVLTAFSWCFLLEVRLEFAVSDLPASVPWLGDALFGPQGESQDAVKVAVRGEGGYKLSTSRPADENSGAVSAWRGSASVTRDRTGAEGQWATAQFWFWPLPPSGTVEVSLIWPLADLNVVLARFSGEALRAAAQRSVLLDADMRPIGPHD